MRLDAVVTPAEARLPEPAEGGGDVTLAEGVHRDGPGTQGAGAAQGALDVGGEDGCRQPVFGVVGKLDRLVEAFDGQDRPEDLLPRLFRVAGTSRMVGSTKPFSALPPRTTLGPFSR